VAPSDALMIEFRFGDDDVRRVTARAAGGYADPMVR
jgi:hypothetical protein